MKTLPLTDDELRYLIAKAKERCADKHLQREWSTEGRMSKGYIGHLKGVMGEYAVAQHVNGQFDDHSYGPEGDHDRPDVIGEDGTRYAVKSTHYWPPILKICHPKEIEQADAVALCHVTAKGRRVTIVGTIPVEQFWAECYQDDFGYGKRWCYQFSLEQKDG